MIPGYRYPLRISRIQSAICHVMCDYCTFECKKCLAKDKEMLRTFVEENVQYGKDFFVGVNGLAPGPPSAFGAENKPLLFMAE